MIAEMKYNYKQLFVAFLMVFFIQGVIAQVSDGKKEKLDALKASFISKKVNFTDKEATAFWPLYNEMNDKLDANRRVFRTQYNANTNYNFSTDKEAEAYLNAELSLKQKEFEVYKEYYEKFKKILPVKKVAALRRAEEDFKKEIIKSIKDN
jgi:lipopolysaccharide export LptBFGC system permease protein LptF